jgi:hypothetical protein
MVRPWNEIVRFYDKLLQKGWGNAKSIPSMSNLVREIEKSPYAMGLFPWTSHTTLCIAQTYVEYPYNGPYLRITPLANDKIEFRYVDNIWFKEKQWSRIVAGVDAFARLDGFVRQLHWFTHYPAISVLEREERR